jgi:hypothetical protein
MVGSFNIVFKYLHLMSLCSDETVEGVNNRDGSITIDRSPRKDDEGAPSGGILLQMRRGLTTSREDLSERIDSAVTNTR